jgi:N-acetylneuraminic acid mutarotase
MKLNYFFPATILICLGASFQIQGFSQNTWIQKTNFGGAARYDAVSFSIGNKGYIGTGDNSGLKKDFWEYNPSGSTWMQKADFGGSARQGAVGFSIGTKGYVGTGYDGNNPVKDFWEFDPIANTWTKKADFGGTARTQAAAFSIGANGYIGTGVDASVNFTKDFWQWNQASDTWTAITSLPDSGRSGALGFSIDKKGYLCTGYSGLFTTTYYQKLWEYDTTSNTWAKKADFPGNGRSDAAGFSFAGSLYLGMGGQGSTGLSDFWEWNPALNTWTQRVNFSGTAKQGTAGFAIGSKGYIGTGTTSVATLNCKTDLWEYTPLNTSVEETQSPLEINIYPNPSRGIFTVNCDKVGTEFSVYSATGEKIISDKTIISPETIDITTQPDGIYFISVKNNHSTLVQKIVIQK